MKTQSFIPAALFAAALFSTGAAAQSVGAAQPNVAPDTPTPNQFVYLAQVPSPSELKSRAAAQGVTIERVDQTANQTIVVYKYPNGVTTTVGYSAMPAGDEAAVAAAPVQPAPPTAAPAPGTVMAPATSTVVYDSPYYGYGPYYPYYWGWYPPVSIGLGFGWRGGGGWGGGHGWRR